MSQQKKTQRFRKRGPQKSNKPKAPQKRNVAASDIDITQLVKKATAQQLVPFESKITYKELDLHAQLFQNISNKGYKRPTEIQERTIEPLTAGKNLIGVAATGTGKTGAFLIPIIQQMLSSKGVTALVVVPTRELAQQVREEFLSLTKGFSFHSVCFIGGTNLNKDIASARRRNHLIVGTPGRLNDLMERRALNLKKTSILVLDEFDRMLDMGFIHDVRKITGAMTNRQQTLLFSATVDQSQEKLIKEFIKAPLRVNVTSGVNASDHVNQDIIRVGETEKKYNVLLEMLRRDDFEKVILFAETKRTAERLSIKLRKSGLPADAIHGNKSQNYRTKAIKKFKQGKTSILVATDVAARGIDVDNVTHVINYQLPRTMDSYIHRIGRTGRAGKVGMAYTFVN